MKKNNKRNRIIAATICIILIASMVLGTVTIAFADNLKIVTLGQDLTLADKSLMLQYFGVSEDAVKIIEVTNADEHKYLDGILDNKTIGTHTYSCSYIELTESGGIHVKTANLNWVTGEMLQNALVTSGIENCNVVAAAPREVSGTGSLTGILMAYEEMTNTKLSEEKKEIANEELVTTADLADTVGQESATEIIKDLKEEVIADSLVDSSKIESLVEEYIENNSITITEEQKWQLIELLLKISKQDYDIDAIKQSYQDIKQTTEDLKKAAETTKNILEKIIDWIKILWQKIIGTYEEVSSTEEYKQVQEQLGIIFNTNDEVLGDDAIITDTDDITENKGNEASETETTEVITESSTSNNADSNTELSSTPSNEIDVSVPPTLDSLIDDINN